MRVYAPDSLSDESLSSPVLDCDYLFPGPFDSFLEEDLEGKTKTVNITPSSTGGTVDPNRLKTPPLPLQLLEDSVLRQGVSVGEDRRAVETNSATGGSSSGRIQLADQERRRFSASELISRLQLSQRTSSFTLKLGKSLSARVASRDRQASGSPCPDSKCCSQGGTMKSNINC